ncbi:DUF4236 domain-containing protein [Rhodococcus spelaei]|uniref:DUF4236 domain-containing protein n=1 Tax=Rhodococcus spelaei TaxID=2546320 RepID=A0A541AZ13_9NOCA|nr:DUF4236 domain-containing protein [Rhodococcus spelaei]TQF65310.1 DUF4236 domain-containing protein [Rhodococcus spelaei]
MVQFRKSTKIGPIRLTASKRGLSVSAGAGPLRISRGADGKVRRTISAPGTGIYDTKVVSGAKAKPAQAAAARPKAPKREYSSTESGVGAIILAGLIGIPSIGAGFVIGIVIAAVVLLGGIALLVEGLGNGQSNGGKGKLPSKPGWYPDPYRAGRQRYWTGAEWSSKSR